MNKIVVAVVGGLVAFVWSAVSWMALPFHNMTLNSFTNETIVASVLKTNAPADGIYIIPFGEHHKEDLSKQEKQAAWEKSQEKMKKGPFVFAAVKPKGTDPFMGKSMLYGLIKDIVAASLIVWLLGLTSNLAYGQKVSFIAIVALIGSIVNQLPNLIWWGFPIEFIALNIFDILIAWFLAGLVMAKLLK